MKAVKVAALALCSVIGLLGSGTAKAEQCLMECDHYGSQHDYLCNMTVPEGPEYRFAWTLRSNWIEIASSTENVGWIHAECMSGDPGRCMAFGVRVDVTRVTDVSSQCGPNDWYYYDYATQTFHPCGQSTVTPVCTVQRGNL